MLVLLANEVERLLLASVEDEGEDAGKLYWWKGQYSYILWQRILLCYDKYNPILSDEERDVFESNIKYFGLRGVDLTNEYISVITEKVKLMLEIEQAQD